METVSFLYLMERYAKATGKPCMYVSFDPSVGQDEIVKAAPYLAGNAEALMEGSVVLLFESEEERDRCFAQTVGEDGPTKLNPYKGPARVFACTGGKQGLRAQNT